MTGTDEFGRELDAQGYERAAGGENVVRPERAAAPGPRAPQPVGPNPLPPSPRLPSAGDAPWVAGGSIGYAEAVFGQNAPLAGRPGPGGAHPVGHDAPTTEFFPGAIFDAGEPEDYQVPPPAASYPPAPPVPPVLNQGSSMPLGQSGGQSHSVPFAAPLPQQDPELPEPTGYEPGYDPLGGSLGGSSSWSAAPPRAAPAGRTA